MSGRLKVGDRVKMKFGPKSELRGTVTQILQPWLGRPMCRVEWDVARDGEFFADGASTCIEKIHDPAPVDPKVAWSKDAVRAAEAKASLWQDAHAKVLANLDRLSKEALDLRRERDEARARADELERHLKNWMDAFTRPVPEEERYYDPPRQTEASAWWLALAGTVPVAAGLYLYASAAGWL